MRRIVDLKHGKTKLRSKVSKAITILFSLVAVLALAGCDSGLLGAKGVISVYQQKLLLFAFLLMLVVVIPVFFLTFWFAWRYRASNKNAKYRPNWAHSTTLEIIWWTIPCIIIVILALVTWFTTHKLDPYRSLDSKVKPVTIEVIALDWKWLFIYPEEKIATVNYIEIPVNTPINFKITSAAPMNSFIIPQLAGQIYAMTGMETQLHVMANETGKYRGFSANYTGRGFAEMQFYAKATSEQDFDNWIAKVKTTPTVLTMTAFDMLKKPSVANPVTYYGSVEKGLFNDVMMSYMMPPMADMEHHEKEIKF
ncbi:MAG: ubiquinol oxidase subunit II [Francisellaceae bacterium]